MPPKRASGIGSDLDEEIQNARDDEKRYQEKIKIVGNRARVGNEPLKRTFKAVWF